MCGLLLLVLLASGLRGQVAPPGTVITSHATVEYLQADGSARGAASNDVQMVIEGGSPPPPPPPPVATFTLIDNASYVVAPGSTFALPHRLTNTATVADTFQFSVGRVLVGGSGFPVVSLAVVHDANNNGRFDAGETQLTPGGVLPLGPGEAAVVLVIGEVSPTATESDFGRVFLNVSSHVSGSAVENTDTLSVIGARMTVIKSASKTTAAPGEEVDFTLQGTNVGGPAPTFAITVDGAPYARSVLRDVIPANATFARFGSSNAERAVYHLTGTAPHAYVSAPPADPAQIDAIGFVYKSLENGQSLNATFTVKISPQASVQIVNRGQFFAGGGTEANANNSNEVVVQLPSVPPDLRYYTDGTYTRTTNAVRSGRPLFLEADAPACNLKPLEIEHVTIILQSARTKDRETFIAVETSPNSGIFRVGDIPTANAATVEVVADNGRIEVLSRDLLPAVIPGCGAVATLAEVIIDPAGIVFHSQTCEPLAGATVTLIDVTGEGNGGHPGEPATVFDVDGVTPAPNRVVTGADGLFEFPLVKASQYRFDVQGLGGVYPSVQPPYCADSRRIGVGSYGETFPVNVDVGAVFRDIPIDVPVTGSLVVRKTASRESAEPGDAVLYELGAESKLNVSLLDAVIEDHLPAGFTYIPGSARRDGVPIADPQGGRGPVLLFSVGRVDRGAAFKLTYVTRIEANVPVGEAINSAVLRNRAQPIVTSNTAHARVIIDDGVFTDRGVLVGKVFVDANANRIQDAGEPGVPGIRLYLEDGTFAITDSEGAYSLYGLRPVTHVVKLDRVTLPPGARLLTLDSRNAGDAGSRFVDLQKGELHRGDFALAGDPEVLAAVERRRTVMGGQQEIEAALVRRLEADSRQLPLGDERSLPAAGLVSGGGGAGVDPSSVSAAPRTAYTALLPQATLNGDNTALPAAVRGPAFVPLETYFEGITDNKPGFIALRDRDTLPGTQMSPRIKGPIGAKFQLLVNDVPVPDTRVAKRMVDATRQVEAWEYLGVDLQPGENTLELVVADPFGNERAREKVRVIAPDRLARIDVTLSDPEPTADGRTPVKLAVQLVDRDGTRVTARTPITLETDLGVWVDKDLDPAEPGLQVFIEGGEGAYALMPPDAPGTGRLVVSSGAIKRELSVPYIPDLRPLIASGVLEGTVFVRDGKGLQLGATTAADAFSEELSELSNTDDVRTSGRAAFFLKGKIRGGVLLTAGYDSDKDTRERLFRDIEPDRYYPVYGDSSIRGFEAQSTRRLYLRIDHKRSYLLVGDFLTRTEGEQRALGNYTRALNGARGHFENNRVIANVWGSKDSTRRVVEEQRADGTSGPYQFRAASGLVNSERVEILTRDRDQPGVILKEEPQERFSDYDFEPLTGRLLFRAPVRAMDENLNPRSIRISYEVDQGGNPFWVYGGDAQVRVTDRIEVGGSVVRDENPTDKQTILSGNTTLRLADNTYLLGELASTDTDLKGQAFAGRVDLRHRDERNEFRLFYGQADAAFENPGSLLTPGRIEGGVKWTRRLDANDKLIVRALQSEDTRTGGGSLLGARADIEHTYHNGVRLEYGARVSREDGTATGLSTRPGTPPQVTPGPGGTPLPVDVPPFEVNSLRIKATTPLPRVANASVYGEYEQDVVEWDQQLLALGGDWAFSSRGRLYARHEFISSLGGPFELNTVQQNNITVFGIETDYMRDGRFFNEYRARNAFDGRQAEASTGLRNQFTLAKGLRLQTGLERVTPFDGTTQNESTAVTAGVEYTDNPDWKGTARVEARLADQSDSYLNSLGYARKLNRDWTLLAKTIYYQVDGKGGGLGGLTSMPDSIQARLLSGLAWRQTATNRWQALGRYEYRYEDGQPFGTTVDVHRNVHIVSLSANFRPDNRWTLTGRYAFKYVDERLVDVFTDYVGQQVSGRITCDLGKRWDVSLAGSMGWSRGFDRHSWAAGPEIGYNLATNMRIGVGYNVVGFYDRDLAGDIPTQKGVFLTMRLKFDEGFGPVAWLADDDDPVRGTREDKKARK